MRYISCLLVFFYFIFSMGVSVQARESVSVSANQAVLIEALSGRIIYEKNSHERRPIASITKVMTALVALEYGNLKDKVKVSKRATLTGGSSIYLRVDEEMTLEDLLYGLMLRSGNDAAVAIAEHIAGSVEGFTFLMNEKAAYLGMSNTYFKNPHGLDEEGHFSSAYDIALLMSHAMENKQFQKISATKTYKSQNRDYHWFNKNRLLTQLYPHSTGGKTGFTKKAGRTLVSTAEKNNVTLIAVTLNASDDWNDHIKLFETYFGKITNKVIERKGEREFTLSDEEQIVGVIKESVVYPLFEEDILSIKKRVVLKRQVDIDVLGEIIYEFKDGEIVTIPIYKSENKGKSFPERVKNRLFELIRSEQYG